ncbi:MAG: 2-C-methyl-D-erythritol 4-phosphate cytidylyltransferase [Elusimicrobia bacterium]|nr:2-C-methyl-D-erythritol 4-phosphate cytidylyltransferase [Elusimicrobiota bacterium]
MGPRGHKSIFILLAAGPGSRFGAYKPAVRLCGKPVIYWSLKKIQKESRLIEALLLALPAHWNWKRLKAIGAVPENFPCQPIAVTGGVTRFQSLVKCLNAAKEHRLEAEFAFVHDAARPLWPSLWISGMLKLLRAHPEADGAVPLIAVRETVKMIGGSIPMQTLRERHKLMFSQTPQLVRRRQFVRALNGSGRRESFLDEAEVLELSGRKVLPYPGDPGNIKLTYPDDLKMLEGLKCKLA